MASRPGVKKARPWKGERPGAATARSDGAGELATVVAFDVPLDNARRKVCEMCKDYGLIRLQWSVFEGDMTRNRREELRGRLERLLAGAVGGGRVAVFPIGAQEARLAWRWSSLGTVAEGAGKAAAGGGR